MYEANIGHNGALMMGGRDPNQDFHAVKEAIVMYLEANAQKVYTDPTNNEGQSQELTAYMTGGVTIFLCTQKDRSVARGFVDVKLASETAPVRDLATRLAELHTQLRVKE